MASKSFWNNSTEPVTADDIGGVSRKKGASTLIGIQGGYIWTGLVVLSTSASNKES